MLNYSNNFQSFKIEIINLTEITNETSAAIKARTSGTQIDRNLTIRAGISALANTHIIRRTRGYASSTIRARITQTWVHKRLAIFTRILSRTDASIVACTDRLSRKADAAI